jgi:hypothetical protein
LTVTRGSPPSGVMVGRLSELGLAVFGSVGVAAVAGGDGEVFLQHWGVKGVENCGPKWKYMEWWWCSPVRRKRAALWANPARDLELQCWFGLDVTGGDGRGPRRGTTHRFEACGVRRGEKGRWRWPVPFFCSGVAASW